MINILLNACLAHKKVQGVPGERGEQCKRGGETRAEMILPLFMECTACVMIREDGFVRVEELKIRFGTQEGRGLGHRCMLK